MVYNSNIIDVVDHSLGYHVFTERSHIHTSGESSNPQDAPDCITYGCVILGSGTCDKHGVVYECYSGLFLFNLSLDNHNYTNVYVFDYESDHNMIKYQTCIGGKPIVCRWDDRNIRDTVSLDSTQINLIILASVAFTTGIVALGFYLQAITECRKHNVPDPAYVEMN